MTCGQPLVSVRASVDSRSEGDVFVSRGYRETAGDQ